MAGNEQLYCRPSASALESAQFSPSWGGWVENAAQALEGHSALAPASRALMAAKAKLEVITKTKKALGKLNSEPAPPGTMIEQGELLDKLVGTVKSLLPSYEIQRQAIEGVSVEEGQLVRDYMQSLVRGPVDEYWPKVMISYATGRRAGLDGEGCGLGMKYAYLLARSLDRHGISCFSGLHVAGGQNWRQARSPACKVYAQKTTQKKY